MFSFWLGFTIFMIVIFWGGGGLMIRNALYSDEGDPIGLFVAPVLFIAGAIIPWIPWVTGF